MRIYRRTHADNSDPNTAFSGDGSHRHGNRWNSRGTRVVYAAENLSLAALELLVHLPTGTLRERYVYFSLDLSESQVEDLTEFPGGWDDRRPSPASQAAGDAWARAGRVLALRVPSVLNPVERNLVLNPLHPEWPAVRATLRGPFPFRYDERLQGPG